MAELEFGQRERLRVNGSQGRGEGQWDEADRDSGPQSLETVRFSEDCCLLPFPFELLSPLRKKKNQEGLTR